MKKTFFKLVFLMSASLGLAACGGGSESNAGNELTITEPNKDEVSVNVEVDPNGTYAVQDFVIVKSLEFGARTNVEAFESLIGDINAPEAEKTFILSKTGKVLDNLSIGDAITVHAYSPSTGIYLEKVVGVYDGSSKSFNAVITPVSTAVFEGFSSSSTFDSVDGLSNDYNALNIGSVVDEASIVKAMVEDGVSRSSVESDDPTKDSAFTAILATVAGNSDVQSLFKSYLNGTQWAGGNTTLSFNGDTVNVAVMGTGDTIQTFTIKEFSGVLSIDYEDGATSDIEALLLGNMEMTYSSEASNLIKQQKNNPAQAGFNIDIFIINLYSSV